MKERDLLNDSILSSVTRQLGPAHSLRSPEDSLQLVQARDDHVFVWNRADQNILAINTSPSETEKCPVQTLNLTDCPLFDVEGLVVSRTAKWVCLYGNKGVTAVEVPRRSGSRGRIGGGEQELVCRTISLNIPPGRGNVQGALWHPGSVEETHLALLTTDNVVRVHCVLEPSSPVHQIIQIEGSTGAVATSLGETAVDMAFGPPVELEEEASLSWPVFVLWANGDVFCATSCLARAGEVRLEGPLEVQPPAEDNYSQEACSIAVLGDRQGPPVLAIATVRGTVYHAVVLGDTGGTVSLHMYEKVELELALSSEDTKDVFRCPVRLQVDPSCSSRYLASHSAGLHQVGLPIVNRLADINQGSPGESSAIVEHLVCTRPTSSSPPAPVLGVTVAYPPASLLCLMSDNSLKSIRLAPPTFTAPPSLFSETLDNTATSPLRRLDKEPFEQHIHRLLARDATQPLLQSAQQAQLSRAQCLELVLRSTATLRTEYINRLEAARLEVDRRVVDLGNKRSSQEAALCKLETDRNQLRLSAESLSERYEDVKDAGERLTRRVEKVLSAIQRQLPVASDAELNMARDLQQLERGIVETKGAVDQLRAKETYQRRQLSASVGSARARPAAAEMGDNQLANVKEVLQKDSKQIAELVKKINSAKKDLGI